jgi:SAM-dependent methyltransferase
MFDLTAFYEDYPAIEERFEAALDVSLAPRGPEMLYDLVDGLSGEALDVGCGEGRHSLRLAERFRVHGVDPVERHVAVAAASVPPALRERVTFSVGTTSALPAASGSVDLVWCRDVLVHVPDLDEAYREFRRVLRPGGRVLVYQMYATSALADDEAGFLFPTMGVVPSAADPQRTEDAATAAGLSIASRIELGSEWGELAQENDGAAGRKLLHAARLRRDPSRYIAEFGQAAYDIMLGDCLWHVYRLLGKLAPRVYVFTAEQ